MYYNKKFQKKPTCTIERHQVHKAESPVPGYFEYYQGC
jgi:hypothetical protein